jgi:hypothetical protein
VEPDSDYSWLEILSEWSRPAAAAIMITDLRFSCRSGASARPSGHNLNLNHDTGFAGEREHAMPLTGRTAICLLRLRTAPPGGVASRRRVLVDSDSESESDSEAPTSNVGPSPGDSEARGACRCPPRPRTAASGCRLGDGGPNFAGAQVEVTVTEELL